VRHSRTASDKLMDDEGKTRRVVIGGDTGHWVDLFDLTRKDESGDALLLKNLAEKSERVRFDKSASGALVIEVAFVDEHGAKRLARFDADGNALDGAGSAGRRGKGAGRGRVGESLEPLLDDLTPGRVGAILRRN